VYDGNLLRLAIDLGNRLLPAFRTTTGIPYGTVNLAKGVPKGETEIASTAGAGSLLLEFEVLSCLSGKPKYGIAAMKAIEEIYFRRSNLNLVGKHINVRNGKWQETLSGVGSNSDSFYEYLLKSYLLFRKKDHFTMFHDVYTAAKKYSLSTDWFIDVDMYSGKIRNKRSENLQAFWPGMEAMLGLTSSSARLLNAFYLVWSEVGFLPEEFDYVNWSSNGNKGFVSFLYPLRPELIESTYFQYRTTGDPSWLLAGKDFMESIEKHSRTECGFATVKDVTKITLEDNMPSFFLSETCKYLYLLFDEENFIHTKRNYIFTTEAHPVDTVQLSETCASYLNIQSDDNIDEDKEQDDSDANGWSETLLGMVFNTLTGGSVDELESEGEMYSETQELEAETTQVDDSEVLLPSAGVSKDYTDLYLDWRHGNDLHPTFLQCPKPQWWNLSPYRPGVSTIEKTPKVQTTQVITKPMDLQDFFKMMVEQHRVDPFDPKTICDIDADLQADPVVPKAKATTLPKPIPDKTVEVTVGEMGRFSVNVFPDGFVINSATFGNTIEIAGIGQPTVFVKEYNSTSSATVIGTGVTLSTCNVRLHIDWPSEIWKKKAYNNKDFSPVELTRNR
jgi:hypothetical protein